MGIARMSKSFDIMEKRRLKEVQRHDDKMLIAHYVLSKGVEEMETTEVAEGLGMDLSYVNELTSEFDADIYKSIDKLLNSWDYKWLKRLQKIPLLGRIFIKWEDSIEPL